MITQPNLGQVTWEGAMEDHSCLDCACSRTFTCDIKLTLDAVPALLTAIVALTDERDRYRSALMMVDVAPDHELSDRYAAIVHHALYPNPSEWKS